MRKAVLIFLVVIILLGVSPPLLEASTNEEKISVKYSSHIQILDWEKDFSNKDGEVSGTTGRYLRMEAIKIKLDNAPPGVKLRYKAHVQLLDWQDWVEEGQIAGTTGQCLRLEAIKIELVGTDKYSVRYRTHVESIGWQDWVEDGQIAGTTGRCLRAEAIQIQIVEKGKEKENKVNKNGIDVSKYQGNIDWTKVKKDNVDFAMIRAGFRGYGSAGTLVTDPKFSVNIKGALNNGIEVGTYFFSQAINEKEAIEEANYVHNIIKNYKITYPVAIDTEDIDGAVGRADNLSKEQRTKVVVAFCKRIKELGYEPMIYANKWWLNEQLDTSKLSNYKIWLAHYTGATRNNPFERPSDYKGTYSMWQYTDKAIINGISTKVDANVMIN